jgi:hypothetical protein
MEFPLILSDRLDQFAQRGALLRGQVFLLVLVNQQQEVDVLLMLQVQVKIAKAAPLPFSAARIAAASLADSTQPADERGSHGVLEEILLNPVQYLVRCISRKFL